MIKVYVITYLTVFLSPAPCPDKLPYCIVNHGEDIDTIENEVIIFSEKKLSNLIKEFPDAVVDTFLVQRFKGETQ